MRDSVVCVCERVCVVCVCERVCVVCVRVYVVCDVHNCVVTVVIIILLSAAVNKPTKRSTRSKKGTS